jgi:hypothetical protein
MLVHRKPAEVSASTLDALFRLELETVVLEKWAGRKTGVSGEARRTNGKQRGFNALVEPAGNAATGDAG